ncbi:MAG: hypothetical protein AB1555_02630 [Nitrospirota bacterium]
MRRETAGRADADDSRPVQPVPTKLTGKAKREILKALNADTLPPPDVIHLLLYRKTGGTTGTAVPSAQEKADRLSGLPGSSK